MLSIHHRQEVDNLNKVSQNYTEYIARLLNNEVWKKAICNLYTKVNELVFEITSRSCD